MGFDSATTPAAPVPSAPPAPALTGLSEDEKDRLQATLGDVFARGLRTFVDGFLAAHFGPLLPTPVDVTQGTVILVMFGKHLREQAANLVVLHPYSKLYSVVQGIVSFLPL